jgi:hypothetical protein
VFRWTTAVSAQTRREVVTRTSASHEFVALCERFAATRGESLSEVH